MDSRDLRQRLEEVGRQLVSPHEVVLVGGAAMILHYGAQRTTRDVDVLVTNGDRAELWRAVRAVAHEHGLPDDWITDAVKGFADILPSDFAERLVRLDLRAERLRVHVIGLPELVAMKIVALREQDMEDLDLLMPRLSEQDRRVITDIMRRLGRIRPDWAQKIGYFLEEQGWTTE